MEAEDKTKEFLKIVLVKKIMTIKLHNNAKNTILENVIGIMDN